jgi:hypothetical protein
MTRTTKTTTKTRKTSSSVPGGAANFTAPWQALHAAEAAAFALDADREERFDGLRGLSGSGHASVTLVRSRR